MGNIILKHNDFEEENNFAAVVKTKNVLLKKVKDGIKLDDQPIANFIQYKFKDNSDKIFVHYFEKEGDNFTMYETELSYFLNNFKNIPVFIDFVLKFEKNLEDNDKEKLDTIKDEVTGFTKPKDEDIFNTKTKEFYTGKIEEIQNIFVKHLKHLKPKDGRRKKLRKSKSKKSRKKSKKRKSKKRKSKKKY